MKESFYYFFSGTPQVLAGILALFAEWEHETIREQMSENKMIKWRDKRSFLGKTPFGYTWNNSTKQLEVNPREAEIYLDIVNMYIEQGMAFRDIAVKLKAEVRVAMRDTLLIFLDE